MFEVSEKVIFSWRDGRHGGFKKQLFELWVAADLANRARIVEAWGGMIWDHMESWHVAEADATGEHIDLPRLEADQLALDREINYAEGIL